MFNRYLTIHSREIFFVRFCSRARVEQSRKSRGVSGNCSKFFVGQFLVCAVLPSFFFREPFVYQLKKVGGKDVSQEKKR
jgi:hypothetical protein